MNFLHYKSMANISQTSVDFQLPGLRRIHRIFTTKPTGPFHIQLTNRRGQFVARFRGLWHTQNTYTQCDQKHTRYNATDEFSALNSMVSFRVGLTDKNNVCTELHSTHTQLVCRKKLFVCNWRFQIFLVGPHKNQLLLLMLKNAGYSVNILQPWQGINSWEA